MKSTIMMAALVAAAFFVQACGSDGDRDQPSSSAEIPMLTIGHVGHDHQIALGVSALNPDRMQKVCGVHLEELKPGAVYRLMEGEIPRAELLIKKVGGGSRMPAAMSEGKIDIGLGGIPAVIFSIDQGNKARILCPLNVDGDMLLVSKDFPAKTWEEFAAAVKASNEPIKIGYKAPMAVAKFIFEKGCEASGIECVAAGSGKPGAVEMINLQGSKNVIPSLESGSVHGAVINEPVGSMAVHKKVARIVALLSDLPPAGMWVSHPCCCVCATEETIAKHPAVLGGLIKMIVLATDDINADKQKAALIAAEWTKNSIEVEKMSVPNIVYTATVNEAYKTGLYRWFDMMRDLGKFQGTLKGASNEDLFAAVHDLSFLE